MEKYKTPGYHETSLLTCPLTLAPATQTSLQGPEHAPILTTGPLHVPPCAETPPLTPISKSPARPSAPPCPISPAAGSTTYSTV